MSAPLKTAIVSAFKAWMEFKEVDFEVGIEAGDSAQLRKIKYEGMYEDLRNEVQAQEAIITDVKNVLTAWGDLLRKMNGEERRAGNEDYIEFNEVHHVENTLQKFEENARSLREYAQKILTQLKIAKLDAEKERQQEELRFHTAAVAAGNRLETQAAPAGAGSSRSLHSLYQLPTLQIRMICGNRQKWLNFYESFKCAVDNSVASEIEKLTLLRSLLEGEARDLISGFRLETRSFEEAIKLLKDYYGNTEAHVRDLHIKLANLKPCQNLKETKNFCVRARTLVSRIKKRSRRYRRPRNLFGIGEKIK
uniref:Uncharacterized protein n=1 Tax=Meloidogyne enterolobii TaxID=390850 RepID=A0A6V7WMS8_MELEN|nr:unnamed protein product [Meloidogyne enterolobii]